MYVCALYTCAFSKTDGAHQDSRADRESRSYCTTTAQHEVRGCLQQQPPFGWNYIFTGLGVCTYTAGFSCCRQQNNVPTKYAPGTKKSDDLNSLLTSSQYTDDLAMTSLRDSWSGTRLSPSLDRNLYLGLFPGHSLLDLSIGGGGTSHDRLHVLTWVGHRRRKSSHGGGVGGGSGVAGGTRWENGGHTENEHLQRSTAHRLQPVSQPVFFFIFCQEQRLSAGRLQSHPHARALPAGLHTNTQSGKPPLIYPPRHLKYFHKQNKRAHTRAHTTPVLFRRHGRILSSPCPRGRRSSAR